MAWKTPKIVEMPVGMEINMYMCATLPVSTAWCVWEDPSVISVSVVNSQS